MCRALTGACRFATLAAELAGARPKRNPLKNIRTSNAERSEETGAHEAPEKERERLLARVEGQVAVSALRIVVGRGQASARGVEASAGDQGGRGAGGGA